MVSSASATPRSMKRLRWIANATRTLAILSISMGLFSAWEMMWHYHVNQRSPFPGDPFFDLYEEPQQEPVSLL